MKEGLVDNICLNCNNAVFKGVGKDIYKFKDMVECKAGCNFKTVEYTGKCDKYEKLNQITPDKVGKSMKMISEVLKDNKQDD